MLPAVTAELPAYLIPPRAQATGRTSGTSPDFGPAATVELSAESVRAAQSRKPGQGLYGPNGHFVEPSSARQDDARVRTQPTRDAKPDKSTARAEHLKEEAEEKTRQLSLAQVDAAVPPAQRKELRDLAKRIQRKSSDESLEAKDYKQIASLMQRVGDFKEATRALEKARDLEQPEPKTESTGESAA
ncbi:MAG: hypothetical protein AABZ08_05780 [Planctomycetota bacterium]